MQRSLRWEKRRKRLSARLGAAAIARNVFNASERQAIPYALYAAALYRAGLSRRRTFAQRAPGLCFLPAPQDGVAPAGYHAMSIFPEYFHVGDAWLLAEDSRMDCVAVLEAGRIIVVREFRLLKAGDLVAMGRTEDGQEGVYVHPDGFGERRGQGDVFAFRQGRSRETAFSRDYDELYELLRHERAHGKIVWVMGPAFAFDHDARRAFSASD